jgi:hypothetical protein
LGRRAGVRPGCGAGGDCGTRVGERERERERGGGEQGLGFELGGSVLKIRMIYWVIFLWLKTRALQ